MAEEARVAPEAHPPGLPRLLRGAGAAVREHRGHLAVHGALAPIGRRRSAERAALLAEIEASGLAGRGGGGFPTARKLALYAEAHAPLLVVNATEGEPASAKDRVLCAHAPHLVLDGATIAAELVGARTVVLACAAGQPSLVATCAAAIAERERLRLSRVALELVETPHGYVSGEESALANFVVTGTARPFYRPSKAVPLERRRRRVLVQNAETLAHLALIARHGAHWFREAGGAGSGPSTLVTVSGAVGAPGVHEVVAGTSCGEILALAAPSEEPRALLVGGYGGGWLSREHFGVGFSPEALRPLKMAPGAGVLVVLGAASCGIGESARIARYLAGESAGQCGPCAFGLPAIAGDLERLALGRLDRRGLERLRARVELVAGRGACAHPDGAARLVRSALEVFAADVDAHAAGRPCAGVARPSVLRFPGAAPARRPVSVLAGRGNER